MGITIVLSILILFWVGFCFKEREYGVGVCSLIMASLTLFLIFCLLEGIGAKFIPEKDIEYKITSQEIVALKDNEQVEGRHFLFTGYIEEKLVYRYAKVTKNGIKVCTKDINECYIKYTDGNYRIEKRIPIKFKKWWHYIYSYPCKDDVRYTFYVPVGSVENTYEVDLE